jgi:hypothetical protein
MNLIIHLPAETEAILLQQARATGKEVETLALEALSEKLCSDSPSPMLALAEWHARLDAMIESMPHGNPDADFSRDSIYGGRGE